VIRTAAFLPVLALLAGCTATGYYAQAVRGHLDLMDRRVPIDEVLADAGTPAGLRERLEVAREARAFAVDVMGLPDNGSYSSYVAVDGRAVVWNVFAAPTLSLEPKRWCFPVAGCVVYRGYFHEDEARAYAGELEADGYDVWVGGVSAYSTLGRFEDPVLSTMLSQDDARLAGTLIHELAHQRLYVADDSAFNEAFATAVEAEGVRRWIEVTGRQGLLPGWRLARARAAEFDRLLEDARRRLAAVYDSGATDPEKLEGKARAFAGLEADYAALRAAWDGWGGFDRWFDAPLNNARLVPSATYRRLLPAFEVLLAQSGGDLEAFYARCEELAAMTPERREERLGQLLASADELQAARDPR